MEIINQPQYIPLDTYETVIEEYVKKVKSVRGVVAILSMGSMRAQGLSDLDLIAVKDDCFDIGQSDKLATRNIDNRLFIHGPVVIPKSLMDKLQLILYASNLKLLWGEIERIPHFCQQRAELQKLLSSIYLVDFTESRFLQFADFKRAKTVDKRAWLARIWSLTHSYELIKKAGEGLAYNKLDIYLERIRHTRAHWLESKSVSDTLFIEALNDAEVLNGKIFERAVQQLWGDPELLTENSFWSGTKLFKFMDLKGGVEYKSREVKFMNKVVQGYECKQNPGYLAHLSQYDKKINPTWAIQPNENAKIQNLMTERYDLIIKHANWLKEHAYYSGSLGGYVGLNTRKNTISKSFLKNLIVRRLF